MKHPNPNKQKNFNIDAKLISIFNEKIESDKLLKLTRFNT